MSETKVWLDGRVLSGEEAAVSVSAPGLLVAMGVFETMAVYDGKTFALERHYRRLEDGCQRFGFQPLPVEELGGAIDALINGSDLATGRARARITMFEGGKGVQTLVQVSRVQAREGNAKLSVSPFRRNERGALAGVKATAYAENVIALREASERGADEVVILNSRNEVCEGATSNLFCIEGESVVTPPLSSGCLPGVTREIVIELCQELGITVREENLLLEHLLMSDGVFLTGSLREVQAVESIGDVSWQQPEAGLVRLISAAFQKLIRG